MLSKKTGRWPRFLLLTLLISSILLSTAGCKNAESTQASTSSTTGKRTITFYQAGTLAQNQPFIDAYQKKYPDVTIKFVHMADQTAQTMNLLLTSGTQIDVIAGSNFADFVNRVNNGMFAPMDSYLKSDNIDWKKTFGADIYNMYKMNGHFYAMPYTTKIQAVLYNKSLFDKAGVPYPTDNWTWDDLKATAKKITSGSGASKVYGYLPNYTGQWELPAKEALGSNAVYKDNKDNETNFDNPAFKYSLQLLYDMENVDQSALPLSEFKALKIDTNPDAMFYQGKVAMYTAGCYAIKYSIDPAYTGPNPPTFDFGIVNIPKYKSSDPLTNTYGTSDMAIPTSSKYKQDAFNFIKLFCLDRADLLATNKDMVPAFDMSTINSTYKTSIEQALVNYPHVDKTDGIRVFVTNKPVTYVDAGIINTAKSEINDFVNNEVTKCMTGNETVDQCLTTIKKNGDQLIKQAKSQ
jgi:multiple sugar transport system substrate-binding protein